MPKASKRVPLARRYNIHKKAKEQERKARRDAKKNPALRKKLRKDLGIPNLNPFKAQILSKLEAQNKIVAFNEAQRQRRMQEYNARRRLGGDDELAGFAADALARAAAFTGTAVETGEDGALIEGTNSRAGQQTRRAFFRHVKAMLEKADIILEVLDARDPLSCRALAVEAAALSMDPPKRIVLVLNKIDLVPPEVVQRWLTYLRREFPTVAFKASTQQQRTHLSAPGGGAINKATEAGDVLTGSGAAGTDILMQLLKNYSRSHDLKRAVTVGVVGYPNVGKSSVINSLKRSKAVGVSSTPGFTRTLQEVSLDSKVTLIDCPGVIFDDDVTTSAGAGGEDGDNEATASLLLRNCISVDAIEDPEGAVDGILSRCAPEKLMSLYAIPAFETTDAFLRSVAAKRGKLGKGGVADKETAARMVLQDWNSGKIPFFVLPPDGMDGEGVGSSSSSAGEDEGMAGSSSSAVASSASSSAAASIGGGKKGKGAVGGAGVSSASASGGASLMADTDEDVGTAAIVAEWSKEFDMASILKAEADMLAAVTRSSISGSASGGAGGGLGSAASMSYVPVAAGRKSGTGSRVSATSAAAKAAAARMLAAADADDDDEEDGDYDDEEDDDDMGGDGGDDDEEEEDDDDEDDDQEEEEDEDLAGTGGAAARKSVRFSESVAASRGSGASAAAAGRGGGGKAGGGKGASSSASGRGFTGAVAGGGKGGKGGASGKGGKGDAYDFGEHFRKGGR